MPSITTIYPSVNNAETNISATNQIVAAIDQALGYRNAAEGFRNDAEDARDDAIAAVADAAVITGEWPRVSRVSLKGLDYNTITVAFLNETDKSGIFLWDSSDHSSHLEINSISVTSITAATDIINATLHDLDTGAGVYVKTSAGGMTAYTMYWVIRVTDGTFKVASSFANAVAGSALDLSATGAITMYRQGDPHEGIYIIPNGLRCDGSQGSWKRSVEGTTYDSRWWGLDEAFDHNQAIITSALHAMPDGGTFVLMPGEWPISRYVWMRWREGQHFMGFGRVSHLVGDGTASSCLRSVKSNTHIIGIKGSNFTGQVAGGITTTDANLSESSGVHVFPLDGTYIENIRVSECEFEDLDSGVSVSINWDSAGTAYDGNIYYICRRVWVEDNVMKNIRRQGVEMGGTEGGFVLNNWIDMAAKGVGFSTSRAVRLLGAYDTIVSGNKFIGFGETEDASRGVAIEPLSTSVYDDPSAVRFSRNTLVTNNHFENFAEDITNVGAQGVTIISGNTSHSDPDTAPSTETTWFIRGLNNGFAEATGSHTVTITIATPGVVSWTGAFQTLKEEDGIRFYTTGALPTGLTAGTLYYIKDFVDTSSTACEFKVSATAGGAAIDTTGSQSGTHSIVVERFLIAKHKTDYLHVVNNQVLSKAYFMQTTGATAVQEIRGNTWVANALSGSQFFTLTGISGAVGDAIEKVGLTIIEGNTMIDQGSSATPAITISNSKSGDVVIVDDNKFVPSTSGAIVSDTGSGITYIRDRFSNKQLSGDVWSTYFNPPAAFGAFDVGP